MARAHFTFEKAGETKTIDLSEYTAGYNGGSYTVKAPTGVTATVSGSKMTVKLADDFGGVGYIEYTLKDKEGDTFTRNIGVTQGAVWKSPIPSAESSSSAAESSSSAAEELSSSEMSSSSENTSSLGGVAANAGLRMNVSGNIVSVAGLAPNSKIVVTDMNGRILYVRKVSGNTAAINLNAFERGLYLVSVRGVAKSGAGVLMNKSIKVQVR